MIFAFPTTFGGGHHESYFDLCPETRGWMESRETRPGELVPIPREELPFLVVKEFPAHISSVIHTARAGKRIRFSKFLRYSGEDLAYLTEVACQTEAPCINPHSKIHCGDGVNLFFGYLNWDSDRFLGIRRDQVIAYTLIRGIPALPPKAREEANRQLKMNRSDFVFHLIRRWRAKKTQIPSEFFDLLRFDWRLIFWLPKAFIRVLRFYKL